MKCIQTDFEEVLLFTPDVFEDERGYAFESFNWQDFHEINLESFVLDLESKSSRGVFRGFHYQVPPFDQNKLVRVVHGSVQDIVIDIRKSSPTFGKHIVVHLDDKNKQQLFIPKGFAHGFIALEDETVMLYRLDNYYSASHYTGINAKDSALELELEIPLSELIISEKDKSLPYLSEAKVFE